MSLVVARKGKPGSTVVMSNPCMETRLEFYAEFTITIAEPRREIFLDAPHSQTLAFLSFCACTMNVSRSAVRSSRWSKPIEQFLRESTQTSPRRGFASATRVTAIQNAQQPRQQRLAGQAGGYGRVEQRRTFSYSPISLHGHLDPPKPGEE